jgi:hypothetical protein
MRTVTVNALLIISVPDGMSDAEGFLLLNRQLNPYGVEFAFPSNPVSGTPAIIARVVKLEEKPK